MSFKSSSDASRGLHDSLQKQGETAELVLAAELGLNRDWRVVRDVLIPTAHHTTQIDFLIITRYCIFVGELKTFQGIITGSGDSKYWKQHLCNTVKNYYSPIYQNQAHIRNLKHFMASVPFAVHFHSLIVMQGKYGAKLVTRPPYSPDTSVVSSMDNLYRVMQVICEKRKMNITSEQREYIFKYIIENQVHGGEARAEHICYVKRYEQRIQQEIARQICPQCHAKLVLRHGKNGSFWGCSNYPRCKFTHNITEH